METKNNDETEIKVNDINMRLCLKCNEVRRFNMRTNKAGLIVPSGRRCIACCSAGNNKLLKERNYYKTYYADNIEIFKERDRIRYQKAKEKKNLVNFTIIGDNVVSVEEKTNLVLEVQ